MTAPRRCCTPPAESGNGGRSPSLRPALSTGWQGVGQPDIDRAGGPHGLLRQRVDSIEPGLQLCNATAVIIAVTTKQAAEIEDLSTQKRIAGGVGEALGLIEIVDAGNGVEKRCSRANR